MLLESRALKGYLNGVWSLEALPRSGRMLRTLIKAQMGFVWKRGLAPSKRFRYLIAFSREGFWNCFEPKSRLNQKWSSFA